MPRRPRPSAPPVADGRGSLPPLLDSGQPISHGASASAVGASSTRVGGPPVLWTAPGPEHRSDVLTPDPPPAAPRPRPESILRRRRQLPRPPVQSVTPGSASQNSCRCGWIGIADALGLLAENPFAIGPEAEATGQPETDNILRKVVIQR